MVPSGNKTPAGAGEPALRLTGIRQSYRSLWARAHEVLAGLDLEVARGVSLGLAGPNGSGKSTLLRLIAGIERPTAGKLEVLGGDPQQASVRRRTGYLAEESTFPAELSARAGLDLFAALQGWPRARRKREVPEKLAEVGLADAARRRLGTFSRGMLRRFGLAQAFLDDPELLLFDEPTAGLDAEGFRALDLLLARARAGGATIVLASHLDTDLEQRCDRVEVLFDGRLVSPAPTEVRDLAHLYARLAEERGA